MRMRRLVGLMLGAVLVVPRLASAQVLNAPDPSVASPQLSHIQLEPEPVVEGAVEPAATGFQLGLELGYALPLGHADGFTNQSDLFSGQVPLVLHLDFKPTAHLGVGWYGGLGVGLGSNTPPSGCGLPEVTCVATQVRLGFEAQASFLPSKQVNPYVSVGIGLESSGLSATSGKDSGHLGVVGPEGHLTFGTDRRFSREVGVGPFVTLAFGEYTSFTLDSGDNRSSSRAVAEKAVHEWVTFGLRLTACR
jgi:hypothetical protein